MNLAEKLKQDGLTYRVFHNRPIVGEREDERPIFDGKGGATLVSIYDADGNFLANGTSVCSKRDNFTKKLGVTIALGRAYKSLSS